MGADWRRPDSDCPSPTRTASWISSVRFHQPAPAEKTTSRNELEPQSTTARRRSATLAALDELDAVAVRVAHEADPRAAGPDRVRRLLGLDALRGEVGEGAVEVLDGHGDVV